MADEHRYSGHLVSNSHHGNVDGPLIQVGSLYGDINIHGASGSGESLCDQRCRDGDRRLGDHKAAASAAVLLRAARRFYVDWPAPNRLPLLLGRASQTLGQDDPIRPWAEAIDSLRHLAGLIEHQELRRYLGHVVDFLSVGAGCKRVFEWDQAFFLALAVCDSGIEACEAFVRYRPLPELSFATDFVTDVLEPSLRPLVEAAGRIFTDSTFRSRFSARPTGLASSLDSRQVDVDALLKRKGRGNGPKGPRRRGRD
ncbi:hypothetical protein [Lentzea sp. NPDC092896]|uniref:hypothetical protein n=1 Tax=Lentzea sp. NPDC092896 TaxID=3364127 RepID=UPI00380EE558